jgi:hypothetical protein
MPCRRIIGRTPLLGSFDAVVQLPSLSDGADGAPGAAVRRLLWLCGAAAEGSEELARLAALVPPAMPLKQILHAVELSRLPPAEPRTAEAEAEAEAGAEAAEAEAAGAEEEGAAPPSRGAQAARAARAAREAEEAEAAEEELSDTLVTTALPYR